MKRSDEMIDMLVSSVRDDTSERDKAVLRRVLCELVRVAQAESVQSIEADFRVVDMAISSKYRSVKTRRKVPRRVVGVPGMDTVSFMASSTIAI